MHLVSGDESELFFNQWRGLNAISDRLMHINVIQLSLNLSLFLFDSVMHFANLNLEFSVLLIKIKEDI